MPAEITRDAFLGGRVTALQPARGFRASTDAVFLAAACPAPPGASVLELGCGVGVASLCLAARVQGLAITGIERQAEYAAIARRNADLNAAPLQVVASDLAVLPADLRARSFDQVLMNPPFFDAEAATPAPAPDRDASHREDTPLPVWIDVAARRLAPGGWLTVIHRAERLPDLLATLGPRLGGIRVLPLQSRAGRPPARVVLSARKGGRAPFRLLPPLLVHAGPDHRDGGDFTPEAEAILRDGAPIRWG